MSNFVKLYGSILDSTIWLETLPTKVVWITMLAMADANGCVASSVPNLAIRAGVTREQCDESLRVLSSPDSDSRTDEHEGRRIEKIDGGWVILNHRKYRDLRTDVQVATAERVRKHRRKEKKKKLPVTDVTNVTRRNGVKRPVRAEAEAEAEEEVTTKATTPTTAPAADASAKLQDSRKAAPRYPSFPASDCDRLYQTAIQAGHAVDYGLFRKTLAPLYPAAGPVYPLDVLDNALAAFLEAREGQPPDKARFWTIMEFAKDAARWVRLGAMPLAGENGITERGRVALGGT